MTKMIMMAVTTIHTTRLYLYRYWLVLYHPSIFYSIVYSISHYPTSDPINSVPIYPILLAAGYTATVVLLYFLIPYFTLHNFTTLIDTTIKKKQSSNSTIITYSLEIFNQGCVECSNKNYSIQNLNRTVRIIN